MTDRINMFYTGQGILMMFFVFGLDKKATGSIFKFHQFLLPSDPVYYRTEN